MRPALSLPLALVLAASCTGGSAPVVLVAAAGPSPRFEQPRPPALRQESGCSPEAALRGKCGGGGDSHPRPDAGVGFDAPPKQDAPVFEAPGGLDTGPGLEGGGIGPDASTPEAPAGSCDPVLQDCPSANDKCHPDCSLSPGRFSCRPWEGGFGFHGDPCATDAECAPDNICVTPISGPRSCHQFCRDDLDCPSPKRCTTNITCTAGGPAIGRHCET